MCAGTPCAPCAEKQRAENSQARRYAGADVRVVDNRGRSSSEPMLSGDPMLSGFFGDLWNGVKDVAGKVVDFAEDAAPYVEAGIAAYNQLQPSKRAQVDRRAQEIMIDAERLGVAISIEYARALAMEPPEVARAKLLQIQQDRLNRGGAPPPAPRTPPQQPTPPNPIAGYEPLILGGVALVVVLMASKK